MKASQIDNDIDFSVENYDVHDLKTKKCKKIYFQINKYICHIN